MYPSRIDNVALLIDNHSEDVHADKRRCAQCGGYHLKEKHADQLAVLRTRSIRWSLAILRQDSHAENSNIQNRQHAEESHQDGRQHAGEDDEEDLKGDFVLVGEDIAVECIANVIHGPPDQRMDVSQTDDGCCEQNQYSSVTQIAQLSSAHVMAAGQVPVETGQYHEPLDQTQRCVHEEDSQLAQRGARVRRIDLPAARQQTGEQGHVEHEQIVDRRGQEVERARIGAKRSSSEDENVHDVSEGAKDDLTDWNDAVEL